MDITRVLEELRRELQYLDAAILSLERIQQRSSRRGRPPKILTELRQANKSTPRRAASARRAMGGHGLT